MFASASLIVGLALITMASWMRHQAHRCKSWPSVEGVVLESRIDDRSPETTKPVLRYRYVVGGREYVGFRVAFSGYSVSRFAMEALIAPYEAGRKVRVHFDPANPARAVLDTRHGSDWGYWLGAGAMFCALSVYLLNP